MTCLWISSNVLHQTMENLSLQLKVWVCQPIPSVMNALNCKGDWAQIGTPGISLENRIKILEVDNILIY